jgi:hypothetical protein
VSEQVVALFPSPPPSRSAAAERIRAQGYDGPDGLSWLVVPPDAIREVRVEEE